jgi:UTP--glucose-1-phosphate uridylyltransferase
MARNKDPCERQLTDYTQAFENTSTNVAAAQMRNALTNLAETVEDPKEKKVRSQNTNG